MKNGNFIRYIVGFVLLSISSCSPLHRFNRLVKCHPYLLDRLKSDTVLVDSGKSVDTFFVAETEFDTFYFDRGVRIERFRDTFRIYYRERNCTTYIEKTEIKPTQIIERQIRQEVKKEQNSKFLKTSIILVLVLLIIGAFRKLFGK